MKLQQIKPLYYLGTRFITFLLLKIIVLIRIGQAFQKKKNVLINS